MKLLLKAIVIELAPYVVFAAIIFGAAVAINTWPWLPLAVIGFVVLCIAVAGIYGRYKKLKEEAERKEKP